MTDPQIALEAVIFSSMVLGSLFTLVVLYLVALWVRR